ncbi:PSD1 and planctomycete cytochrome C domain-containing protein [Arenibacter sp. F20364]|uniref:PSD1 and planctomycete cytochrome C domain-containing protein n=1 Tax=Arenibacter sp. F20364 TaxID=2926415 RepID=UPI001FF13313|nr:PSD1 and planctomycete cytochrome C domain-containing protein [Arenibacter sp. F20364]MCK0191710.1 PSD1 and planctomycete cytochrome C domain-containing protein [Arenibacter sp. F20364]
MKNKVIYLFLLCTVFTSCKQKGEYAAIPSKKIPEVVDYNFDVRPILSDKCFACHGPDVNKRAEDLRLDTPEGAFKALKDRKNEFAIVPNNLEKSVLYQKITAMDSTELMPPLDSNLKLSSYEIQILKKWIEQGAAYEPHWAFVAVDKPELPKLENEDWVNNEIDYFVLQKLQDVGLTPNPMADKERLLKRVSLDITGLPPTPEMQKKFIQNDAADAYEKVVDELLASDHYGEKMASHWLDVARYADSHGFQNDQLRTMWPWRDWVIHAFNENYSYEKFVTYQLAGDLVPQKNMETILATGFNRNHKINQEAGIIEEEFRVENVTDRTNTFGKAFLGLTLECAKCHDHKYDPISQKDYFSTFAFFDRMPPRQNKGEILAEAPLITISDEVVQKELPFINKKEEEDVDVMVIEERPDVRTTHVLNRGVYDDVGEEVTAQTPASVLAYDDSAYERNRLGLTKWLFDAKNPLTSRVFVNRMWQEIFGAGIVRSSGDFGMQGDLPTNVQLLNWLSADFMENGWDMKRMIKKIVMSATYKQSSVISKDKLAIDPENKYLSRMSRLRFNAEMVRDHALATSGLLNPEIGGRSVKVYQPDGLWEAASSGRGVLANYVQDHGSNLYKRGIYIFIKRTTLPPVQLTFDAATRDQCEVQRQSTMTPLQALITLNDPTILESARVFSENLMQEESTVAEKIEKAFGTIVCRTIKPEEKEMLLGYYNEQESAFMKETEQAEAFINVGEFPASKDRDVVKVAALMQIIHTIYNLEETIVKS